VSRILVLGGYGGFGGRISLRLAADGHEVLVAGRDARKARQFCAGSRRLLPAVADRARIAETLAEHRPTLLVDASGPFQAMDHMVAAACIAAGVHYVDIADARDFVCGIETLDAAARSAGVVILSGASSVPALSGAVVRHLAAGMDMVRSVEMTISASNRATAGRSVAAAILGQVGQPLRLWRGGRWERAFGWQSLRSEDFVVAGTEPLLRRWVGLVDVPDLALLPDRLPGHPAVVFRAGTELLFQNLLPWLASWPVRWGWLRSLAPLARWLGPSQRLTRWAGSDRSAMRVRLYGMQGERRVERGWTLIAHNGDGPEIPTVSVPPLVKRILAGLEAAGARDAGRSLRLADYQPAFDGLAVTHGVTERELPLSLYARVMGDRFARLPSLVRSMHGVLRDGGAFGEAIVTGGANPLARIIAKIIGFPSTGIRALHVHFEERDGAEIWTRRFDGRPFRSRLDQKGRWLVERFGPFRFGFDLPSDDHGLSMVMRRWWVGPLRLPLALAPRSVATEWEEGGRFHFDVPIALPVIGRIVHYRGWLEPVAPSQRDNSSQEF
jgi:NAD(P)-dependent dehydrogenase (short-subunit alcohol dehydrogenase family)